MRRNRYGDTCIECNKFVAPDGGFLFGTSNAIVCIGCLYDFYGHEHGYFVPIPPDAAK
ncbi:hypothetical protein [Nocardia sp. NPDC004711]